MIKRLFLFLLFTSTTFTLFSQQIEYISKLSDTKIKEATGVMFYALPRTVINLKITTTRSYYTPGPYAEYAEEFLGIKNIEAEEKIEWKLSGIDIGTFEEPDPTAYYVIKPGKNFQPGTFMGFIKSGLLLNPNSTFTSVYNEAVAPQKDLPAVVLDDISITSFFTETNDTLYKTLLKDSVYIRVPIIRPKTEAKTIRDKAKEAADVIFRIRQNRLEMILGEESALPDANALKVALNEMKRIENEYLELFIGKKTDDSFVTQYLFTPEISSQNQFELFRFSVKNGITDKTDPSGSPVLIEFEKSSHTKELGNWLSSGITIPQKENIIYRLPETSKVNILNKGILLASRKVGIYQFGIEVPFFYK